MLSIQVDLGHKHIIKTALTVNIYAVDFLPARRSIQQIFPLKSTPSTTRATTMSAMITSVASAVGSQSEILNCWGWWAFPDPGICDASNAAFASNLLTLKSRASARQTTSTARMTTRIKSEYHLRWLGSCLGWIRNWKNIYWRSDSLLH